MEMESLDREQKIMEYRQDLIVIGMAARALARIDIAKRIAAIDKAEAIGAIFDPTLYMQKSRAMQEDKRLFEAARGLAEIGKEFQARDEERKVEG